MSAPECLDERSDRIEILQAHDRDGQLLHELHPLKLHVALEEWSEARVQLKQAPIKGGGHLVCDGVEFGETCLNEPALVACNRALHRGFFYLRRNRAMICR